MVAQAEEVNSSNLLRDFASFLGEIVDLFMKLFLLVVSMWFRQMMGTFICHPQETLNSRRKHVYIGYT